MSFYIRLRNNNYIDLFRNDEIVGELSKFDTFYFLNDGIKEDVKEEIKNIVTLFDDRDEIDNNDMVKFVYYLWLINILKCKWLSSVDEISELNGGTYHDKYYNLEYDDVPVLIVVFKNNNFYKYILTTNSGYYKIMQNELSCYDGYEVFSHFSDFDF